MHTILLPNKGFVHRGSRSRFSDQGHFPAQRVLLLLMGAIFSVACGPNGDSQRAGASPQGDSSNAAASSSSSTASSPAGSHSAAGGSASSSSQSSTGGPSCQQPDDCPNIACECASGPPV